MVSDSAHAIPSEGGVAVLEYHRACRHVQDTRHEGGDQNRNEVDDNDADHVET